MLHYCFQWMLYVTHVKCVIAKYLIGMATVSGIRSQDYFVPWNIRSHDGTFVLTTIRSLEHIAPWTVRSLKLSFPEPLEAG